MQLITSKTISPRVNATLLQSDFSNVTRRLEQRNTRNSLQPFINFRGQISVGEYILPVQKFSLREKDKTVYIENFPVDSFPKIEIVLQEKSSIYEVKNFKVRSSDNSVQGQILYTRFILLTAEEKKCSLNFKDIDFTPFNISFFDIDLEEKKRLLYQAKLFRKLGFIEKVFEKTKFVIPEHITHNDARQIEILYRGITEGEFSIPVSNSIDIFNYKVSKEDVQNISIPQKRNFSFEFSEDLLVLDRLFPIGKWTFKVEKGSIANPRILKNTKENEIIYRLGLNVFDFQIHHSFEKYSKSDRLSRNKGRLEQFKNSLQKEEPEFLVNLLDELIAEIDEKSSIGIVEGLLQYHDFPDRFSVLKPELEDNQWRVPIALTYPNHEPIKLTDAFVDVRTGKVEMKMSFDALLKKGKKKAKEAFSIA